MKDLSKSFFTSLLIFAALTAVGQKASIDKKNVERIIRTLSADDKSGRPAIEPMLMEKSIAFIENEFKRIGLKPLDGLPSYRQEFTLDVIADRTINVVVNNKGVSSDNVFVYSPSAELKWDSNVKARRIASSDKGFQELRRALSDTTQAFVFVDTAHAKVFRSLAQRFRKKRILNTTSVAGSKIFILSPDTSFTSYQADVLQRKEKIVLANVVGQIKAPDTKESVIFSAHYDHIGILDPLEGDSVANGADDDASGTTAVITLAEHFSKQKGIKRNLIFVAFTAEEVGGYGSRHFSNGIDPANVAAMFNIEMIGKLSKWGPNQAFITGFERSDFGTILQHNLTGSPYTFNPDPYPNQNLFYRSDNATLARLGVPAHTISTDQIDIDKFYHTVNDEFETLDVGNMTEIIRAIALSASSIAKGVDKPSRVDTSKVE